MATLLHLASLLGMQLRAFESSPSGGPNETGAKRQHITGRVDGRRRKTGVCLNRPHTPMFMNCRYAAFAFFGAAARDWLGFAFSVAFRADCAFSLAANSCLTLDVIAATSTL